MIKLFLKKFILNKKFKNKFAKLKNQKRVKMEAKIVCKDFMFKKCKRENCRFGHIENVCFYFWKNGSCKFGTECNKSHDFKYINKENKKDEYKKDEYKKDEYKKNENKKNENNAKI